MLARFHSRRSRRGMTIVESALIMGVFLLLLFGIFEYCRFLLVLHVTNNAARDGARYAAVRVNTDSALVSTVQQQIITYTRTRMGGTQNQIQDCRILVYAVDQAGLDQTTPVIRAKRVDSSSQYPDPFLAPPPPTNKDTWYGVPETGVPANGVPWNNVGFTERVAVTITGTYKPLIPTFLLMPTEIPIKVTALMAGES